MVHILALACLPGTVGTTIDTIRPALEAVLAPYDDDLVVPGQRVYADGPPNEYTELDALIDEGHFDLDPAVDIIRWADIVVAEQRAYSDGDSPILHLDEDGERAYWPAETNPDGRWSSWRIGGRFHHYLLLANDRPTLRISACGPECQHPTRAPGVDAALRRDIAVPATLTLSARRCYDLVDLDGQWRAPGVSIASTDPADRERLRAHHTQLVEYLTGLPPDTVIVTLDCYR